MGLCAAPVDSVRYGPFHGPLTALLDGDTDKIVVTETYPREFYQYFRFGASGHGSKRKQEDRIRWVPRLLDWAKSLAVSWQPDIRHRVEAGFSADINGEDEFDAVVGLLGMIAVVTAAIESGEPSDDPAVLSVEGWILGRAPDAISAKLASRPIRVPAPTESSPATKAKNEIPQSADSRTPLDRGTAGQSAQAKYERLHRKEQERLERTWGRLSGMAKALHNDPQSITAWRKGAKGERRVAGHLERLIGDRAVFLHDRRVPGTRGNVDLLIVAPSGIWIVDAKHYKGKVKQRNIGGRVNPDLRLFVGGRDRSAVADGMRWQAEAVKTAVGDSAIPIHSALCFVDADWGLFSKPFQHNGVWVGWVKRLAEMVQAKGSFGQDDIDRMAMTLAEGLPAR